MKILYAIQGTGNGHVSRAREVVPILKKHAEVDVFLSGNNSNVELPFEIKYQSKGLSMEYDRKGGVSYLKTMQSINPARLYKEIRELPVQGYDLVVNDFEFISARAARFRKVPLISFSHQAAVVSQSAPKPEGPRGMGWFVLKYYAPAPHAIGFHFKRYDKSIYTPVIRSEIRILQPSQTGHYTVYLPATGDREIIDVLRLLPEVRWEVFSKTASQTYTEKHISIFPARNDQFIRSMETCDGLLCGAGFEAPAEALHLKKKLFVIPIQGQYEQYCNAAALREMGVPVAFQLNRELVPSLHRWITNKQEIPVLFPDITEDIILKMLADPATYSNQE
jgi:uncharacterized protein (TIGR00661 family)